MKKAKLLLLLLLALPTFIFAQMDCSKTLKNLEVDDPFTLNSLSKTAVCVSGRTYEFTVPLTEGHLYRFIFKASSAFNNDLHFKMTDLNANKEIMNLPGKVGENEVNEKGKAVLEPYIDELTFKNIHPFFDVLPTSSTSIKIVIEVEEMEVLTKGCVTVIILDREFDDGTFK